MTLLAVLATVLLLTLLVGTAAARLLDRVTDYEADL